MFLNKSNKKGHIEVSDKTIASIAGNAACECYGVLGLAPINQFGESLGSILESDDFIQGVQVKNNKYGYEITIYIIVAYGLKVTEIVSEVQKRISYVLKRAFDLSFNTVNVFVQSIKTNS